MQNECDFDTLATFAVGDLIMHNTQKIALIAHISSDPDMKKYLLRFGTGKELRADAVDILGRVSPDDLNEFINVYLLQQFLRYKDVEVSEHITFAIEASASSSANELAVKHKVSLAYGAQSFVSKSLAFSLTRTLERYHDAKQHEVLALPAS